MTEDSTSEETPAPKQGLKRRVMGASLWTVSEFAFGQGFRFITNLILARLLVPEVFGLMQIIQALLLGLEMLSDLGIHVNIIQSRHGERIAFRRTAWMIQMGRSWLIWITLACLAWPLSSLYDDPRLLYLLPFAALNAPLGALASTNIFLYQRRLNLGPYALINLAAHVVTAAASVFFVWSWRRDPCALILGTLIGTSLRVVLSHLVSPGPCMKCQWDKAAALEIVRFGRWIVVSSLLAFSNKHLDRLLLGIVLSKSILGCYGIAIALASFTLAPLEKIAGEVLIPLYSRLHKMNSPTEMRRKLSLARIVLSVCALIPTCLLIIYADPLVNYLYPPAYADVAWMLKILCAGMAVSCITSTSGPMLLAVGDSFRAMVPIATRSVIQLVLMSLGAYQYGMIGVIVGLALAELVNYPVVAAMVHRYHAWQPLLDLSLLAGTGVVIYLGSR